MIYFITNILLILAIVVSIVTLIIRNKKTAQHLTVHEPTQVVTESDDRLLINKYPISFVTDVKVKPLIKEQPQGNKIVQVTFIARDYIDKRKYTSDHSQIEG